MTMMWMSMNMEHWCAEGSLPQGPHMFITNLLLITNNKNTQTITMTKIMKMITVSMNMEHGCAGVYYLKDHRLLSSINYQ